MKKNKKLDVCFISDESKVSDTVKEALDFVDKLYSKEYSQDYYDMMKKHGEELDAIHKEGRGCPWEYSFGLEYLVEFMRFMRDYYLNHEGVTGMELRDSDPKTYKNAPTRLESLEEALYYYDKYTNLEEEYIKTTYTPETFKHHDNGDGTATIDDFGIQLEYKYGSAKKTYKKLNKAYNKYRKKFFMCLYKHMEEWWD